MAVYQGARLRTDALPAAGIPARHVRAAAPASVATAPRVRPMGLLMAAIVASTILGLVYLTQTLGSSATSEEIYGLQSDRNELIKDTRILQIHVMDAVESDVIVPRAKKQQLKRLDGITVLSAP